MVKKVIGLKRGYKSKLQIYTNLLEAVYFTKTIKFHDFSQFTKFKLILQIICIKHVIIFLLDSILALFGSKLLFYGTKWQKRPLCCCVLLCYLKMALYFLISIQILPLSIFLEHCLDKITRWEDRNKDLGGGGGGINNHLQPTFFMRVQNFTFYT